MISGLNPSSDDDVPSGESVISAYLHFLETLTCCTWTAPAGHGSVQPSLNSQHQNMEETGDGLL